MKISFIFFPFSSKEGEDLIYSSRHLERDGYVVNFTISIYFITAVKNYMRYSILLCSLPIETYVERELRNSYWETEAQ